jgi:hypothetical protein
MLHRGIVSYSIDNDKGAREERKYKNIVKTLDNMAPDIVI